MSTPTTAARLIAERDEALAALAENLRAIRATATQGNYDELAIRKVVSFELAELIVAERAALSAPAARQGDGSQPMDSAPKDGTHILGYLYSAPDDCGYRGFGEWREIWWKPYQSLGMNLPWHAGDPFDSHSGNEAPEHFGEGVPIAWRPLPSPPTGEGEALCPRPVNSRPEGVPVTARDCVEAGECGCSLAAALTPEGEKEGR